MGGELDWYPPHLRPAPYDIVWCRFPNFEKKYRPGPKQRPALVRRVLQHPDLPRIAIEVAYGTSKISARDSFSFVVMNVVDMVEAGLPQATRFQLDRTIVLPWAREYFVPRPNENTPVVGCLTKRAIGLLEAQVKILRAHGDLPPAGK